VLRRVYFEDHRCRTTGSASLDVWRGHNASARGQADHLPIYSGRRRAIAFTTIWRDIEGDDHWTIWWCRAPKSKAQPTPAN